MNNWRKIQLGDVVDLFDHIRIPLNAGERAQRKGPYPYYGAQGIIDYVDDFLFNGRYLLVPEDGENLNSRKLPIAYFAEGKFWVNNHAHILRAKIDVADDVFLKHWINNCDVRPYVTGAAQPKLSQANLRRMELALPPIETQQRIAAILGAYDDLIEVNQRRIALLKEMARRLFEEWFVRFRFPGSEGHVMVATPDGPLPEGWNWRPMETVCTQPNGVQTGPFGSQLHQSDYVDDGVPVVMPKNIIDLHIVEDDIARISEEKANELGRHRMSVGDVVYGRRGDIGRRAYISAREDGWFCGTGCLRMRPDASQVRPRYFFDTLGLHTTLAAIRARAQGATMPNLSAGAMSDVPVMVPPLALQQRYEHFVEPLVASAANLRTANGSLALSRDLLLPRLISGDLSVTAAERELEAVA